MSLVFKFVEVAPVTDETLEAAVNEWSGKGWTLEGIRFAMSEASRRPVMAFVSFVRGEVALAKVAPPPGRVSGRAGARSRSSGRRRARP